MSSVQPASATPPDPARVRAAIADAARATGVDFNYLLAQARIESNLDPNAAAASSSARGLYQFLGSTWLDTLDRHGTEHGLGWASDAIERSGQRSGGRAFVSDPAMRARIMNLRLDPAVSSVMAAELADDNAAVLQGVLGRAPDSTELYLAHFLGSDGAARFLAALQADPGQSAADLFPKPAASNRAIFFNRDGRDRSLGEVMGLMRDKMARAGAVDDGSGGAYVQWAHGGAAPAAPPAMPSSGGGQPSRAPMSELLRTTFIADGASAVAGADRVHAAYSRLKAFGL